MATTSSSSSKASSLNVPNATRSHLEQIEQQFDLTDEKLIGITRQFVDDFALGLGEYNKAMAMM